MKKIGITGQAGFIGTHLYNYLGLFKDEFERIPFRDEFFSDDKILREFVSSCDVIVHLAAVNRHHDPDSIYQTNVRLVRQLIAAMEATGNRPHILFSSSTQEEQDNPYGRSKKEGRELLEQWAGRNNANFTGLVIPNVFGPFGNPYYNSVVATFCYQLTHDEHPKIETDGEMKLIYVGELVKEILDHVSSPPVPQSPCPPVTQSPSHPVTQSPSHPVSSQQSAVSSQQSAVNTYKIPHTSEIKVSSLLNKLEKFKKDYFENGIIPDLSISFDRNLFNTFLCYIDHQSFFPFKLKKNSDDRGSFVETMKLQNGGQISFSTTKPSITRGNHFHTRKAERFAVIKGKARIELRKIGSDKIMSFDLDGGQPSFVDMPVWHTHKITNTGEEELYTIFWVNEFYDPNDPDTFFEAVEWTY